MTFARPVIDWLRQTYSSDSEKITNGEALLALTLMLFVCVGLLYLVYRQIFPARRKRIAAGWAPTSDQTTAGFGYRPTSPSTSLKTRYGCLTAVTVVGGLLSYTAWTAENPSDGGVVLTLFGLIALAIIYFCSLIEWLTTKPRRK